MRKHNQMIHGLVQDNPHVEASVLARLAGVSESCVRRAAPKAKDKYNGCGIAFAHINPTSGYWRITRAKQGINYSNKRMSFSDVLDFVEREIFDGWTYAPRS